MSNFNSIMYRYSNMGGSSQILLFLIILVTLMLISIFVINFITKNKTLSDIKPNKSIKKQVQKEIDNIKPTVDLKKQIKKEPIEIKKEEEKTNINVQNKEDQANKKQEEKVVEIVSKKTSIEEIAKLMENTLEQEPIDLTKFEEDQEENAIISYDELVKRAGAKKIVYKCEEEPIEKIEVPKCDYESKNEKVKFQASKVISPVFGVQKKLDEENTFIDLEEIEENNKQDDIETQNDMEFLGSLRQFRSKL